MVSPWQCNDWDTEISYTIKNDLTILGITKYTTHWKFLILRIYIMLVKLYIVYTGCCESCGQNICWCNYLCSTRTQQSTCQLGQPGLQRLHSTSVSTWEQSTRTRHRAWDWNWRPAQLVWTFHPPCTGVVVCWLTLSVISRVVKLNSHFQTKFSSNLLICLFLFQSVSGLPSLCDCAVIGGIVFTEEENSPFDKIFQWVRDGQQGIPKWRGAPPSIWGRWEKWGY